VTVMSANQRPVWCVTSRRASTLKSFKKWLEL